MKKAALQLMRKSGGFRVARVMSAGMGRILMYHNFCEASGVARELDHGAVDLSSLRRQLQHLRRRFQVIPLSEMVACLRAHKPLHRLAVAITIDDGRRNFYEQFFPLAKELSIPATFFVVTSFIDGTDWLWTDKILWLSRQPSPPRELRFDRVEPFFRSMNQLPPVDRNRRISAIAAAISIEIPSQPPPEFAPCSWRELKEMADSGLVEIGSHTVTHPILASISEEESRREIVESRAQIEQRIARPVRFFCYPNGKTGDYGSSQVQQVVDAGYLAAVSAESGLVPDRQNIYMLPRIGVSSHGDELSFAKELDGVEHYQRRLLRTSASA